LPLTERIGLPLGTRVALVLGGGNALGAYHAGLYEALHREEIEPDWIVGTSIGAITGAIIAGNMREGRLDRLRRLWRIKAEPQDAWPTAWNFLPEDWRRTGAVIATLLGGRPGLFGPIGSVGESWRFDGSTASPALYDTRMLSRTLTELIDFARLNEKAPRFTAVAVDIETGDEVKFDTAHQPITPDHIRASAALLTAFPAVEIDGRLLADGGLSLNLPLDPVMAAADGRPTLCIAADLVPLSGRRPETLGEAIARMQDLNFAAQTRRSIERWQAEFGTCGSAAVEAPSMTLIRLAYSDQGLEVAGKTMDFSPETIGQRWSAGYKDGARLLDLLRSGSVRIGQPGLTVAQV
jgi:NTE family protein